MNLLLLLLVSLFARGVPLDVDALTRGPGVRIASLSTATHACAYWGPNEDHPATCVHRWKPKSGAGEEVAIVSTLATWAPGEPFVKPIAGGYGAPRSMLVARRVDGAWQVATGPPPDFTRLGVATVYGNWRDAGEVGGAGVELHPNPNATLAMVDCTAARMPVAAFHSRTGEILTRRELGDWFEYRLDRGDAQRNPFFLREPVLDPVAWQVQPHDQYHLSRAFMDALGIWRATGDPACRALILVYAEDARIAWTLGGKDPDAGSSYEPFSLRRRLLAAEANPGRGGDIVRGVAWTLRLFAAAVEVGAPNRAEFEAEIKAMLRYVRLVQMPSGAFYDARYGYGLDQDEPVDVWGLDVRKGWCPSWQVPFLVRAVWEAQKVVPGTTRLARAIVLDAKKLWRGPRVPGEDGSPPGLPRYLVVSVDGIPVFEVTEGVGPARGYYDDDAFTVFAEAAAGR